MKASKKAPESTATNAHGSKSKKKKLSGFEEWGGYMQAKKQKLDAQFSGQTEDAEVKTEIFKGVAIFVNGYTRPTADELKRLMATHGGRYHYYYSSSTTTHTIASNLPQSKIRNLKGQVVVTPNWITDSIKAEKLLPHHNYLLYTPEFTNKQQRLAINNYDQSNNSTLSNHIENISDDSQSSIMDCIIPNTIAANNSRTNSDASASSSLHKENPSDMKAGHPNFLSEFYGHSRLHHISTSGQELKSYVQKLVAEHKGKGFIGREKLRYLKAGSGVGDNAEQDFQDREVTNVVMHLDMDCFFVSVGLRNHPDLKGKPVAVTHSKGKRGGAQEGSDIQFEADHYRNLSKKKLTGAMTKDSDEIPEDSPETPKSSKYSNYGSLSEIASCSYEARKAGLRNGMFLGEALRRCPDLKTIPYDFESYAEVSKQLYDIVASYTLDVEAISCDELYIDCADVLSDSKVTPEQFSAILRAEIEEKTHCTASAGLGSNMLLARLATRVAKPNGQYLLPEYEIDEFMKKQKVDSLPGVGYSTSQRLQDLRVVTCGDLQVWSLSKLQQEFGPKTGQSLFDHCRGRDSKLVQLQKERKSVSAEINYGIRFEVERDIYNFINELAVEVHNRLEKINKKGKSVTLKLKVRKDGAPVQTAKFMGHGVCDNISKSSVLRIATDDPKIIAAECCFLVNAFKFIPQDYRGVGIQISKLEDAQNGNKGMKTMDNFLVRGAEKIDGPQNVPSVQEPSGVDVSPAKKSTEVLAAVQKSPAKILPQDPYAHMTIDQMDQSVLNALPENLQKELLSAYGAETKSDNNGVLKTKQKGPAVSKSKKKSPSKQQKPQSNLLTHMLSTKAIDKTETKEIVPADVDATKANLAGAVCIIEVRSLIKKWIESAEAPREDDIEVFRNYVLQLIDENLEILNLVVKYFYRLTNVCNNSWKQAYLTVLSYVQQKMLHKFGTMLDAECDFT